MNMDVYRYKHQARLEEKFARYQHEEAVLRNRVYRGVKRVDKSNEEKGRV